MFYLKPRLETLGPIENPAISQTGQAVTITGIDPGNPGQDTCLDVTIDDLPEGNVAIHLHAYWTAADCSQTSIECSGELTYDAVLDISAAQAVRYQREIPCSEFTVCNSCARTAGLGNFTSELVFCIDEATVNGVDQLALAGVTEVCAPAASAAAAVQAIAANPTYESQDGSCPDEPTCPLG